MPVAKLHVLEGRYDAERTMRRFQAANELSKIYSAG